LASCLALSDNALFLVSSSSTTTATRLMLAMRPKSSPRTASLPTAPSSCALPSASCCCLPRAALTSFPPCACAFQGL
jgi:hypothetical protein